MAHGQLYKTTQAFSTSALQQILFHSIQPLFPEIIYCAYSSASWVFFSTLTPKKFLSSLHLDVISTHYINFPEWAIQISPFVFSKFIFPVFTWNCHSYLCPFSRWLDFTFFPIWFSKLSFLPSTYFYNQSKNWSKIVSLLIIENLSYITLSICLVSAQPIWSFFFYFSLNNVVSLYIFI